MKLDQCFLFICCFFGGVWLSGFTSVTVMNVSKVNHGHIHGCFLQIHFYVHCMSVLVF